MSNASIRKRALLVGDTRQFHLGSYLNCKQLELLISRKYSIVGFEGDGQFRFVSYPSFLNFINNNQPFLIKIRKADKIFFNGEGFMEPNSPYGKALFYLAKFIRDNYQNKSLFLINFSCFDSKYGDWQLFDKVVPRDGGSYAALKDYIPGAALGFDCSILERVRRVEDSFQNTKIIFFQGRKKINASTFKVTKDVFPKHRLLYVSAFWPFKRKGAIRVDSLKELSRLMSKSFLVISSSFHGIIFSTMFRVPFIPINSIPIPKNQTTASDILGTLYKERDINEWLRFYRNRKNYNDVCKRLNKMRWQFKKRARMYQSL